MFAYRFSTLLLAWNSFDWSEPRETGLRACILKADCVASDYQDIEEVSISSSKELENLTNFQVLYAHLEALVESRQVLKLLKKGEFQNRIQAIVVDKVCTCIKCNTLIKCFML